MNYEKECMEYDLTWPEFVILPMQFKSIHAIANHALIVVHAVTTVMLYPSTTVNVQSGLQATDAKVLYW